MPGSRRERELARAKFERQQSRRAAETAKRRRRTQIVTSVVVAVLVVGGVAVLAKVVGGSGSTDAAAGPTAAATDSAAASATIPTDGSDASCVFTATGTPAGTVKATPPPATAPTRPLTSTATLVINGKPVKVALMTAKAPCTVSSFEHLAEQKFYDNTPCHRLTKGSLAVLQCGDPGGTGSGGPGYAFPDENLTGATYKAGTVAMANSGPDTNGSQFFIVYADSSLPPSYTPFGTVTSGLDVVQAIAATGVKGGGTDGAPAKPVTLDTVTIGG